MSHSQHGLRNRMKRPSSLSSQPNPTDVFAQTSRHNEKRRRRYMGNPLKLKNKSAKAACLQIFFTLSIIFFYFWISNKPSTRCDLSDPMCPNQYFSNSYHEARQKFLKYSSQIHESKTYNLPIVDIKSVSEYGVKQTLFTDITMVNANSNKSDHLIIHISGIHGIEGYVGSGIQSAILSKMSAMTVDRHLNKKGAYIHQLMDHLLYNHNGKKWMNHNSKTDTYDMNEFPVIMFVHALNPFGMYHGLRANENGIDLNRNLKTKAQWTQFNKDQSKNEEIDAFLNPDYGMTNMVTNTDKWIFGARFFMTNWVIQYLYSCVIDWHLKTKLYGYYLMKYAFEYDIDGSDINSNELFERFIIGQNYDDKGLQYVGTAENGKEKSHIVFMEFLKKMFKENNWDSQFKKITLLDVHSGFGKYGLDKLTVSDDKHLKEVQRIGKSFNARTMVRSSHYGDDKFANGMYKNVNGMSYGYMDFIANECMRDNSIDELGVLQHFGTYDMEYMLNAIRFDHAYQREYHKYLQDMDENDEEQRRILKLIGFLKQYSTETLKSAFYVTDLKWRRQVISGGYDVFAAMYRR